MRDDAISSSSGQVVISSKINIFLCLFLRKCKFKMYDCNVMCSTQECYGFHSWEGRIVDFLCIALFLDPYESARRSSGFIHAFVTEEEITQANGTTELGE